MNTDITPSKAAGKEMAKPSRRWHSWRVFDDLMEDMQRRWNTMLPPIPFISGSSESGAIWKPFVDLVEKDNEMVLKADLPGIKKEDIEVSLENGDLVVRGEQTEEEKLEEENYYRLERHHGSFYRRLALPAEVEAEDLNATFKDGVLEVRFPKPAEKEGNGEKIAIH